MFRCSSTLLIILAFVVVSSGTMIGTVSQARDAQRSVREGVYATPQAERGRAVYEEKCTSCHAARMWGSDWIDKNLGDLYDTINGFMPADDPGSLSSDQTRDVIAYILRMNKLPSGPAELPESLEALKRIRIEAAP